MKALMGLILTLTLVNLTSTEVAPNYAVDYSYPYRSGNPGIGYNTAPHENHYIYHTKPQFNTFSYNPEIALLNLGYKRINLGLTNSLGLESNNVRIVSHYTGLANNAGLTSTYPGFATYNARLQGQNQEPGNIALTSNYGLNRPGFTQYNSPTGLYSYKIPLAKAQTSPVARYLAVPLALPNNHFSLPGRRQNFNYYSPTVKPYTFQENGLQFVR